MSKIIWMLYVGLYNMIKIVLFKHLYWWLDGFYCCFLVICCLSLFWTAATNAYWVCVFILFSLVTLFLNFYFQLTIGEPWVFCLSMMWLMNHLSTVSPSPLSSFLTCSGTHMDIEQLKIWIIGCFFFCCIIKSHWGCWLKIYGFLDFYCFFIDLSSHCLQTLGIGFATLNSMLQIMSTRYW